MARLGYNFKLIPKQKDSRIKEILEVESISRELAKHDIFVGNKVLSKAIIYDNERDTVKKFGKQVVEGVIIEEEPPEFEVKYPGIGT